MVKRTVTAGELQPGDIMLCEAWDNRVRPLLCAGYVLSDAAQIDTLVSNGLLVEGNHAPSMRGGVFAPVQTSTPPAPPDAALEWSAVQILIDARRRLEQILDDPYTPGFPEQIRRLLPQIARACRLSRDASLATALFEREGRYSIRHSLDVAVTCHVVGTAIEMPQDELEALVCAALTMNLSILNLQDELQAQKGRLTEQQQAVVHGHPYASAEMLKARGVDNAAWLAAVAAHHETHAGTGYPQRLQGEAIPRAAQVLSLADVYCARVSSRKYRAGLKPQDALRALLHDDGRHASQELAARFIQAIGVFPAGTPVRLANGEIAVVTARGKKPTKPEVCSIVAPDGMPFPSPVKRDTNASSYQIAELIDWSAVGAMPRMRMLWGTAAALR